MNRAEKVEQLQNQIHDLMVSIEEEGAAFYGLRIAWEAARVAAYCAAGEMDGVAGKYKLVRHAMDDFEEYVLPEAEKARRR